MPPWVTAACHEYNKRLPRNWLKVVELPLAARCKAHRVDRVIAREGEQLLAATGHRDRVVALAVNGIYWSTEQLSQQLDNWQRQGDNISLLIGGPDGLSAECLARSQQQWSLSPLTLPHPLARVVLIEQLYRAWSILQNHPYHK